jgi:hypothetical protein
MVSGSKVTPTLNPDTSPYDESDDDDDNEAFLHEMGIVYASITSQDFTKFWGNFFAFDLLVLIENSQGIKNF